MWQTSFSRRPLTIFVPVHSSCQCFQNFQNSPLQLWLSHPPLSHHNCPDFGMRPRCNSADQEFQSWLLISSWFSKHRGADACAPILEQVCPRTSQDLGEDHMDLQMVLLTGSLLVSGLFGIPSQRSPIVSTLCFCCKGEASWSNVFGSLRTQLPLMFFTRRRISCNEPCLASHSLQGSFKRAFNSPNLITRTCLSGDLSGSIVIILYIFAEVYTCWSSLWWALLVSLKRPPAEDFCHLSGGGPRPGLTAFSFKSSFPACGQVYFRSIAATQSPTRAQARSVRCHFADWAAPDRTQEGDCSAARWKLPPVPLRHSRRITRLCPSHP